MQAALALASRGQGRTAHAPAVGCVIVKQGKVVGRGWTQPGGRPHAEAMALAQAGGAARDATAYVTLEPCAHEGRGPACADALADAGLGRVVAALVDPDPRTCGRGLEQLRSAGIAVTVGVCEAEARRALAGFFLRQQQGRPLVTLKLALSLDGQIALAGGESQWITGPAARAHAHLERARADLIVIGGGTLETDDPALDVRLPGLEAYSPRPAVLSHSLDAIPPQAKIAGRDPLLLRTPADIAGDPAVLNVLVEGGAGTASAFLDADLVDRLLLYRAPILIGRGIGALGDIGLSRLGDAHGRWRHLDTRMLGSDSLDVYERNRES